MRERIASVILALLLAPGMAMSAGAQEASLAQCQALKDRIERYTAQRRKGGSASQMGNWRKKLRAAEEQFGEKGCREYRRELK